MLTLPPSARTPLTTIADVATGTLLFIISVFPTKASLDLFPTSINLSSLPLIFKLLIVATVLGNIEIKL